MSKIFLSVGRVSNDQQDDFVKAVESRLRAEGFEPKTVGRNYFGADAPLKTISHLMDECSGTVIIALERTFFPSGVERRGGPNERTIQETRLPTPWNQIEAAMAYERGHPLLVLVENGLRLEGLLEPGYDWFVHRIEPRPEALLAPDLSGLLADWRTKVTSKKAAKERRPDPGSMTIGELASIMKPTHLYGVILAIFAVVVGAYTFGTKFPAPILGAPAATQRSVTAP